MVDSFEGVEKREKKKRTRFRSKPTEGGGEKGKVPLEFNTLGCEGFGLPDRAPPGLPEEGISSKGEKRQRKVGEGDSHLAASDSINFLAGQEKHGEGEHRLYDQNKGGGGASSTYENTRPLFRNRCRRKNLKRGGGGKRLSRLQEEQKIPPAETSPSLKPHLSP